MVSQVFSNKTFDFDASVDQEFVQSQNVLPVGPEDPTNPDTPYGSNRSKHTKFGQKNVDKILNRRATATRTVSYFY